MNDIATFGSVEMMWRNKRLQKGEPFSHVWRHYAYMSKTEAEEFMQIKAHRSAFFDFRIRKDKVILPPT